MASFVRQLLGVSSGDNAAPTSSSSSSSSSSGSSSSSIASNNHAHSLRVADSVVGNKVIANTKNGYKSKWNTFIQYLQSVNRTRTDTV